MPDNLRRAGACDTRCAASTDAPAGAACEVRKDEIGSARNGLSRSDAGCSSSSSSRARLSGSNETCAFDTACVDDIMFAVGVVFAALSLDVPGRDALLGLPDGVDVVFVRLRGVDAGEGKVEEEEEEDDAREGTMDCNGID